MVMIAIIATMARATAAQQRRSQTDTEGRSSRAIPLSSVSSRIAGLAVVKIPSVATEIPLFI
jgi:hypothetical protein